MPDAQREQIDDTRNKKSQDSNPGRHRDLYLARSDSLLMLYRLCHHHRLKYYLMLGLILSRPKSCCNEVSN